eukprot:scaffold23804_cov48-Cyclotella_meneghiniana.AAC.11
MATIANSICLPPTKTIKLSSTTSRPIGLFEISTFDGSSGMNIASQATVISSSSQQDDFSPLLTIDGNRQSYFLSSSTDNNPWYELSFPKEVILSRIVLLNKWCDDISDPNGCLCDLSSSQLHLYDGNGVQGMLMNLDDTCGELEITTDDVAGLWGTEGCDGNNVGGAAIDSDGSTNDGDGDTANASDAQTQGEDQSDNTESSSSISAPHDFGSVMDAISNSNYHQASIEAASDNLYKQHAGYSNNNNNNNPLSKEEALNLIQVIDKETIPHQCHVAITTDLSDNYEKHPVVFCNFNVPIGLYTTAEIQPVPCEEFTVTSKGEVYSLGVASAIYIPEVTDIEQRIDVYNNLYCARIDVYYGDESIYNKKFPVVVTYRNYEVDGKYGVVATLDTEEDGSDVLTVNGTSMGLGIMVGLILGSLTCMAVLAMLNKKKEKREGGRGGSGGAVTEIESLTTTTNGESSTVGVVKPDSFTIT